MGIATLTITPGTGPNAGQDIVTLARTGHPGASYVLEATTDLQNWTPLSGILSHPTGALYFTTTQDPPLSRRCYRFLPQ